MTKNCSPEYIVCIVCKTLELDVDKLKDKGRETKYVDGRFIIAYLLRTVCDIKYTKVAPSILNRTAVAVKKQKRNCLNLLKNNKEFRAKYEAVFNQLNCA